MRRWDSSGSSAGSNGLSKVGSARRSAAACSPSRSVAGSFASSTSGRTLGVRGTVVAEPLHRAHRRRRPRALRGLPRRARRASSRDTVRDSARESNYRFVGPVEVDARRPTRGPASAISRSTPRSSRAHGGRDRRARAPRRPPDPARRGAGADRAPPRLRDRALRLAGVPPSRRGPPRRARLRGRRPRLAQRHDGQRRRRCRSTRSPTAT